MENFNLLDGSDTLKASRDTINNNLLSVRSLSSGTAFPTDNLSVGMLCYRTDLKRLYQYKENGSWSADVAMSISGNADTANSAGTAATAATANRATVADSCTGNSATATTAEKADKCTGNAATATAMQTPRNINGVPFDGTADITIVNSVAQGGTGATTAQEARANLEVLKRIAERNNNADLNSFTEAGIYFVTKDDETSGWDGISGSNGFLEVYQGTQGDYAFIKQVFRRCGTSGSNDWQTYTRQSQDGGETWGAWKRIDGAGHTVSLDNLGYYETLDGLIIAWSKGGTFTNATNNILAVNKPIPFQTLFAVIGDRLAGTAAKLDYDGQSFAWLYEKSTNTQDSFIANNAGGGVVSVFWIGKAV
jgi:hypothetical protein